MQRSARWLLGAGVLALGIGAGLYGAWQAAVRAPAAPGADDGVDWAAALEQLPEAGFERPSGPWQPELPADHGAHPRTRTESWIVSAHLRGAGGARIGVQLALLRVGLVGSEAPERDSAWAARHVYRGHVVLVAEGRGRVAGEERFSRAALGLAGHDANRRRIWLEDWSISYGRGEKAERLEVEVGLGDTAVELVLTPAKPAVAPNADDGGAPFRGFALTRLTAEGAVRRPSGREAVSGLAWLDHLWGEVPLPAGPIVWDRVQLHLDDGSDVSMVRTRRRHGAGEPAASGYRVDGRGGVDRLAGAAAMQPARDGEHDGAPYPLRWRLGTGDLDLRVAPVAAHAAHDFSTPIWSGPVTADGHSRGRRVTGAGFLELTGYESR